MGSIGRHIFRTTSDAFLPVLVGGTALLWITQALRGIGLTNQPHSIPLFGAVTALAIPLLWLIIARVPMMLAIADLPKELSSRSELVAMNAAGMPALRLFRPFLMVAPIASLPWGIARVRMIGPPAFRAGPRARFTDRMAARVANLAGRTQ